MNGVAVGNPVPRAGRLLLQERRPAGENMAFDERLLARACAAPPGSPEASPALRFYGWLRPTLSLGRAQRSEGIDLESLARRGCDWVRRPSGGRAVWHEAGVDLTFSLLLPGSPGLSVTESYRRVGIGMVRALRRLGIEAGLGRRRSLPARLPPHHPACFAAAGRSELTVEGRKLAGLAQARRGGWILHQGSLCLDWRPGPLERACRLPPGSLAGAGVGLRQVTGLPWDDPELLGRLREALREAWGEVLGIRWEAFP